MLNQPLVSIIVPTKNSAEFLEACLVSIKNQTYKNVELIVVDNFSNDGTIKIAEKYTSKVFNKGPERSAQRNFGVKKSKGDYVLIIDSDMELSKNVVAACVEKIKLDNRIKGVIIPEESFGIGFWAKCKKLEKSFYVGVDWMEAARFFDKEVFEKSGGFDENMVSGEDWDLSQRIEKFGKIGRISDFIFHNEGKVNLSQTIKKKFYYAGEFAKYTRKNKNQKKVGKQIGIIFRYKLFFLKPHKLFKNPILGLGMLFMKTCEFGFGGAGYLVGENKKTAMYKNIIPKLVSFDTKSEKIRGFGFSENFNFYNNIGKENKFHYQILIDNSIKIPSKYSFRNGYYLKSGDYWFYERKIFKNISLKFRYDIKNRVFVFNKMYSIIPFEIGSILPVGKHISDLINLELFLNNYTLFRGCAISYENKNICVIGPSFNGKTSFVRRILRNGGKYISEDILTLNFKDSMIFPSSCVNNFGRITNKQLINNISTDNLLAGKFKIDKLFLIQNSTDNKYNAINKDLFEYLNLNSLFFKNNNFIKSYIFEEKLTQKLFDQIDNIKNAKINYKFVNLKNFNFDKLIK